jgi:hypothetical protein
MNTDSVKRMYKVTNPGYRDRQRKYVEENRRATRAGGVQYIRQGYSAVPRSLGAAVTGEMKYFDTENTGTNIPATTTTWVAGTLINPTSTINLGDAAVLTPNNLCSPKVSASLNGRIGRKIKVLKLKIHGNIVVPNQAAQSAADAPTFVRFVLVQDTQTNATAMTAAQLFNDASANSTTIHSFQNPNNFGRFKVLKEKKFLIGNMNLANDTGATGGLVQAGISIPFKVNIVFREPVIVNFNATNGGTVADIIDNSFHVVCACSSTAYAPALAYYSRVCYKE